MTILNQPCPSIGGLQIIKGDRFDVPAKGQVTIIECWASWCAPCRAVFPHLSQIRRKYADKGLRVIGVTSDPYSPQLASFVNQQGANMDYTVACDAGNEVQTKLQMPAGAHGIPHAFVVDMNGIVRYSGHPADPRFENTVSQLCSEWEKAQKPALKLTRDALEHATIKDLKAELQRRGMSYRGFLEKSEFVDALLRQA